MPDISEDTSEPEDKGKIITSLAELPHDAILDEIAMAETFGVAPRTIRRMVERFELPPPIMLASRRRWKAGAVQDWINREIERREKNSKRYIERVQ